MTNLKNTKIFALAVIIMSGADLFSAEKKTFKELTSDKNSKKVAKSSPVSSAVPSTIGIHSLGIAVGQVFLKGDFKDNGSDNINWDLYYNYSASHSFDFVANFHYSTHKLQSKKTQIAGLALGAKAKLYSFDAFSPYVIAGLGFYAPTMTRNINGTLKKSESKIVFGDHLGLGADLRLNRRVTVGIIGHFHNPFDVNQQDGTIEVEGSYFKLLIAALYSF